MNAFDDMLSRYACQHTDDKLNAIREVMQQVTRAMSISLGLMPTN